MQNKICGTTLNNTLDVQYLAVLYCRKDVMHCVLILSKVRECEG